MKSLNSFLNPKRKENLKFVLSDAFIDESGQPIEWEMRQLSAQEGLELQNQISDANYTTVMTEYVAAAMVYPNLHDVELLNGLSQKVGRKILKASDALVAMLTDAELAEVINRYSKYNELTTGIEKKVEEVKN